MEVCIAVKNSIWYDPRVKKQINEYIKNEIQVSCVGMMEPRFNEIEVKKLPCNVVLSKIDDKYFSEKRSLYTKILRELVTNRTMYKNILKTKPDLIHANDLNALIPSYMAARKLKCKIIYDTHEIFIENPWIANNRLVKNIWGMFEKIIISKVDKVICVSHSSAEYLEEKYKIEKPMVVTNAVPSAQYILPRDIEPLKFEVLNHGQFYGGRGYDVMVKAAPLLSEYTNIQLTLRGFGELENSLRTTVLNEKLNNVVFAPPVKVEELITEAASAWIGVALTEPISINFKLSVSNKLFEYTAAGIPVIMSDIPEHRYLNQNFKIGIILKENSPECLAEEIIKLYKDPQKYKILKNNVVNFRENMSWEIEFQKLLNAEKKILGI